MLQRLQRQATKLNTIHALLFPRSPAWVALTAVKPWNNGKIVTTVLHQRGHGLARVGFLQAQRRAGRNELDVLCLAPALDTRKGHPAIWEKLLAHLIPEAAAQQTARIYADVPDQPLLVNTFCHVGFSVYARQTVWRLMVSDAGEFLQPMTGVVRAAARGDDWDLMRLYAHVTPKSVQLAEGALGELAVKPPIVEWSYGGDVQDHVLASERSGEIQGCVRVVHGRTGVWMQLWADTLHDSKSTRSLLAGGLAVVRNRGRRLPVYVAVKGYQGGLAPVLADFGFAPFTDHAKMVKPLMQRVVEMESVRATGVDVVPEALVTSGPVGDR